MTLNQLKVKIISKINQVTDQIEAFDFHYQAFNSYPKFTDLLTQASQSYKIEKYIETRELFREFLSELEEIDQTV